MSVRAQQKRASRARILEAARALFERSGYEAATVRMIAAEAGLSIGGVFSHFTDKLDILFHLRAERLAALTADLDALAPLLRGSTYDRICSIYALIFRYECRQTRLLVDYVGASYGWSAENELANARLYAPMTRLLIEVLDDGVRRGELRAGLEAELVVQMLAASAQRTLRAAFYGGWSAEEASARFDALARLLFQGLEIGPPLGASLGLQLGQVAGERASASPAR